MSLGPVRFHHLKAYGRSAMHGHYSRTMPDRPMTSAMELGAAVDAMIFGHLKVVCFTGKTRRGKDWDAFKADNEGSIMLLSDAYATAREMATAVMANPLARQYIDGDHQKTQLFRWNGMDCRATPDVTHSKYLTELKTSFSSNPEQFQWRSLKMKYHAQMRMQQLATADVPCMVICIESKPPFPVQVFQMTDAALIEGEKCLVTWSERLKVAEESQQYPAYSSCVMPLDVPDDTDELIFPEGDEE